MKKYFILAAAVLAMTACSNDESVNIVQNDNAIKLTASVAGASNTRAGVDVQSTAFATGEEVNVECTPSGGTLASAVYTADAVDNGINTLTLKVGETPLRWPASGTVNIDAYYPSSVATSVNSFSVQENQSTDANYMASDLMYATNIPSQTKQSTRVGLTFNHALTKIIVNLTAGDGMSNTDIAGCTIKLSAMKTVDITKGIAGTSTSNSATITMGTGANTAAIIVPQTIAASTNFITITTSGNHSISYAIPAGGKTFAAGSVYTYNLTVAISGITLQSTTITSWNGDGADKTINDNLTL